MESFGTRLANLRKEHNLTQNDIADRLNISAQAVSKWENDLTSPDINTIMELADIFNITVDELVGKKKKETVYLPAEERRCALSLFLPAPSVFSDFPYHRHMYPRPLSQQYHV